VVWRIDVASILTSITPAFRPADRSVVVPT
jgi:hypothetical protein